MHKQSGASLLVLLILFVLLTTLIIHDQEEGFFIQHIELNQAHSLTAESES